MISTRVAFYVHVMVKTILRLRIFVCRVSTFKWNCSSKLKLKIEKNYVRMEKAVKILHGTKEGKKLANIVNGLNI